MTASINPEVTQARALLATCHHLLTGREISVCEDITDNGDGWSGKDWVLFECCDGQDFRSLVTQFSREIANWIDDNP